MPDKLTKDYNRLYLDYVRRHASIDYQSRIPDVNKANMAQIGSKIMNYEPAYNEFLDTLVNVIAEQKVRGVIWNNPLKEFKRGELAIGGTISEIYVDIIASRGSRTSTTSRCSPGACLGWRNPSTAPTASSSTPSVLVTLLFGGLS